MKLIAAVIYMCMSGIGCSQYNVDVEPRARGAKYHGNIMDPMQPLEFAVAAEIIEQNRENNSK